MRSIRFLRRSTQALLFLGMGAVMSCDGPTEVVTVASVEVTPSISTLGSAGTLQLSVRALDAKGTDLKRRDVIWSSSNTSVATIATTGLVTAGRILGGTSQQTTITALIGGVAGSATLTVTPVPVASITISPASISIRPGQTLQLTAYPVDNTGTPLTGRSISWTSSDTAVFTVSSSGLLRGSAYAGTATRSATVSAAAEGQSASILASGQPSVVASVRFADSTVTKYPNQVFQATAVVRDSAGIPLTGRTLSYSSSDTAVATVSPTGVVSTRAYSGGQTRRSTITATFEGQQGTMLVTVAPTPVSRVAITPDSVLMAPLRGVQLTFATTDSVGAPLTGRTVVWKSNDTTIAVVTATGEVTTKALPSTTLKTTTITATVEQRVGSARVVVSPYLTDPGQLNIRMTEAVQDWFNTQSGMDGNAPMLTAAQTYTASWNNFDMNYYSSLDPDGTRRTRPWKNESVSVSALWDGFYRSYGKATDVLDAIRLGGASLGSITDTRSGEVLAGLTRAAALAGLALNYDQAILSPSAVGPFVNRKGMRDAALAALDSVITLASGQSGSVPPVWLSGQVYSVEQLGRVANTVAAHLLANWPRIADENAQVDWARVARYASKGISSLTPFDFQFTGDGCQAWCPMILTWFNALDSGRLHTRIANMLDPGQLTPWPQGGNPQPNSSDKRLGDGSFGSTAMIPGFGNVPKTASSGSDFAYSTQVIFNMARGSYHQSNIGHIRYDLTGTQSPSGIYYGYGNAPVYSAGQNDLLWAEGLIRSAGDLATAAALINKTRVGRGGREPALASEGATALLAKLALEIELEQLGIGASPFYFRRRVSGLIEGTPFEMPVPAGVMTARGEVPYTFGGPFPAASNTPP